MLSLTILKSLLLCKCQAFEKLDDIMFFGQPAFFLAGNRMSPVAFEKEVFYKLSLFSKTIQFDRSEV